MLKKLILVFLVAFSLNGWGQNEAIHKEILNYSDSKADLITKGRKLLLDKFLEGDFQKVKEIKDYLKNDLEDDDYAAFYHMENWLILYWTQEYQELIGEIKELDDAQLSNFRRKIKPPYDLLGEKIRNRSVDSKAFLQAAIRHSALEKVDKDFLTMNLAYMLADAQEGSQSIQDSINTVADTFLASFPDNPYETFTRTHVRHKYVPSKWGLGFEFFSGYATFTGSLRDRYKNQVPIGVAFDIQYKNTILYLRDYIAFANTRKDISFQDGIWKKNSQVRVYLPEASLGYVALDDKRLKVVPFAGIASTDIGPTEVDLKENPDLKKAELEFTTTYTLGLNVDIKLGQSKMAIVSTKGEQSYWFVRLRYAYNLPQFEGKYDGINGNLHYLTIGIGGFGRKIKRDY